MITKDDRKRGASFVEGNRNDLRSAQGFTGWYDRVETRNVNYENRAAEGNSEYENRAAEGDVDYENRAAGEIAELKQEMSTTKTELQSEIGLLKDEMSDLKNEVTSVKVTLENVTNRHLKTIAEGHCDLSRKLDEAIKGNVDEEQLLVRVGLLEDDVRLLKEKVNTIA